MGKILQLTCPSCSGRWQLQIGHGIAHATLKNALNAFPQEIQERILSDAASEPFPIFDFQYRASICPTCRKPIAVAEIKLHNAGSVYTSPCPDCGAATIFPEESADVLCPNCSQAPLTSESIGSWD